MAAAKAVSRALRTSLKMKLMADQQRYQKGQKAITPRQKCILWKIILRLSSPETGIKIPSVIASLGSCMSFGLTCTAAKVQLRA